MRPDSRRSRRRTPILSTEMQEIKRDLIGNDTLTTKGWNLKKNWLAIASSSVIKRKIQWTQSSGRSAQATGESGESKLREEYLTDGAMKKAAKVRQCDSFNTTVDWIISLYIYIQRPRIRIEREKFQNGDTGRFFEWIGGRVGLHFAVYTAEYYGIGK